MADAIERNAERQNLYREVNERVAEVYSQFGSGVTGDRDLRAHRALLRVRAAGALRRACQCFSAVTYERVRSDPTTFILLPGHGIATVEDVIEHGDGFLIARNIGRAADIARQCGSPPDRRR